ncbi:MAG: flagellar biosynthetic protein FliO [Deltaproteobacteria bacterium]|nr:flagellar biosynthetic protein FliO [Deltaproteobacteria bacterium]
MISVAELLVYPLLLLVGVAVGVRCRQKFSAHEAARVARIVQVIAVGPKQRICVFEYRGVECLVGVTEHSVCVLPVSSSGKENA